MKNLILITGILLMAGLAGCKEDAATPATAEGLVAYPGKNRAKLEFTVPAGVHAYKLFYNTGKYLEVPVTDAGALQSYILDGLNEGEQILRVVTLNAEGVASTPRGARVTVYGDDYRDGLTPRPLVGQTEVSASTQRLVFDPAAAEETNLWVVYNNRADSVNVPAAETSIQIANIDRSKNYYYYSVFKPEPNAIDEVESRQVDAKTEALRNFYKRHWIAAASTQAAGHGVENAIDSDSDTYWSAGAAGYPQTITLDMGCAKQISGGYLTQAAQGIPKDFKVETSADGSTGWAVQATSALSNNPGTRQKFAFGTPATARHLRITLNNGYDSNAPQLAEINLYNDFYVTGINGYAPVSVLVNTKPPFTGVPNPEAEQWWERDRIQKLAGWTHNAAALVSVSYRTINPYPDMSTGRIAMFSHPPAALPYLENGKVHQTVHLDAGEYQLVFHCDGGGGVTAYGVATKAAALPDLTAVTTNSDVLGYDELTAHPNQDNVIEFALDAPADVTIGWVYNTAGDPEGSAEYYMTGIDLLKAY
jgi:hypothetical protein